MVTTASWTSLSSIEVEGEPAISFEDLRSMFMDKRFPDGWESWKKTRLDWVINTTTLAMSAGKAYLALQRKEEKANCDARVRCERQRLSWTQWPTQPARSPGYLLSPAGKVSSPVGS